MHLRCKHPSSPPADVGTASIMGNRTDGRNRGRHICCALSKCLLFIMTCNRQELAMMASPSARRDQSNRSFSLQAHLKILGHRTVSMGSLPNLHRDYPSFGEFPGSIYTIYCLICKKDTRIGCNKPQPPLCGQETGRTIGYISRLPKALDQRLRHSVSQAKTTGREQLIIFHAKFTSPTSNSPCFPQPLLSSPLWSVVHMLLLLPVGLSSQHHREMAKSSSARPSSA